MRAGNPGRLIRWYIVSFLFFFFCGVHLVRQKTTAYARLMASVWCNIIYAISAVRGRRKSDPIYPCFKSCTKVEVRTTIWVVYMHTSSRAKSPTRASFCLYIYVLWFNSHTHTTSNTPPRIYSRSARVLRCHEKDLRSSCHLMKSAEVYSWVIWRASRSISNDRAALSTSNDCYTEISAVSEVKVYNIWRLL